MMKTPEDIIQETINMIDEYEAKVDEVSKRSRKLDKIISIILLLIILLGTVLVILF